jgi:hypothetical protein
MSRLEVLTESKGGRSITRGSAKGVGVTRLSPRDVPWRYIAVLPRTRVAIRFGIPFRSEPPLIYNDEFIRLAAEASCRFV